MISESKDQEKELDFMDAQRRLKLGRDLARGMLLASGVNAVLVLTLWIWNPHYIQFFWYAGLLVVCMLMARLQRAFEAKGWFDRWAMLWGLYIIVLATLIPFFIHETVLAAVAAYPLVLLVIGLLLGTKQVLWGTGISILGFIANLSFGHLSQLWFPALPEPISSIMTTIVCIFVIGATGIVFYIILSGQENLYRQAQLAKMESEQDKAIAESANRAKSIFLANMSHELRTPLNAILGFSQIMARDTTLDWAHRDHIEIINRSGEHLLGLINNVLDIAKIESGYITLQERRFDLHKLVENLGAMFRLPANSKGINLTIECAPDVPVYIKMDDGKLRQVLINLLGNAVKFTSTGAVMLRVSRAEAHDHLHFEVEDTGIGIATEELPTLFHPFSQTASGRQTGEGTGLGLPISRQFIRLMGGELAVQSQPGKGTCFLFDVLAHSEDQGEMRSLAHAKPRVVGLEAGQPAYRLLIVEDQDDSRRLLTELLSTVGFQVKAVRNGQEAVLMWQEWHPQLIWMDMRMPIMGGREATQKIKSLPGSEETIIIALTASSFVEEREQILADGCDDFIRKPYREDEIFDALTRHLGVRFVYESGAVPQGQAIFSLNLAGLPDGWLSQLEQATLEADAQDIRELAYQVSQTHPEEAQELVHLSANFAYDVILAAIAKAKEAL